MKSYFILVSILRKLGFISEDFRKNIQTQIFMTMHPVKAEMFHADGRTNGQRKDRPA